MKKGLVVVFLVVAGGLSYVSYSWLHSPVNTMVNNNSVDSTNTVLGDEVSLSDWQTTLFSTLKTDSLQVKQTVETLSGSTLGSYLLTSMSGLNSDQVGVTVASLGNGDLSSVTAIELRRSQSEIYKGVACSPSLTASTCFVRDDDHYESSMFWQHGTNYIAVVASGSPERRAELSQSVTSIVSNWQWR
ncbi:MAG: hypothetical protein ABI220_04410 [Candidatus Saccharimonadales bacterium]